MDIGWLGEQEEGLLRFGAGSRVGAGFGWLDDDGRVDPRRHVPLWVTCRMTHVYALAHLRGWAGAADLLDHGIRALRGALHDEANGGWYASVSSDGRSVVDDRKEAYGQAFVLLAASSGVAAGHPDAATLLGQASTSFAARFWVEEHAMAVDEWDAGFTELSGYRGLNANMHTVEAFLAVGAATGDRLWWERAARIADRVTGLGPRTDWRLPEHFDEHWRPLLDYNRDRPADPFRPFGATVGHGLEWSRLLVCLDVALSGAPGPRLDAARALYARARTDGWAVDGADGFVYTTDWQGRPVVHERMHWVAAEAAAAAATLAAVTGEDSFGADAETWWAHIRDVFVEPDGSWRHEVDRQNRPSAVVWQGRPDVYHAYQAVLAPQLAPAPGFAAAVAAAGRP